jgi:dTDP-4-dehydrorhamnose 3,5-epimerase
MKIIKTQFDRVFIVEEESIMDERGEFSRVYCENEFKSNGLTSSFVQINRGKSTHKGTLRGFHFQLPPYQEAKYVRVKRGRVLDVALDIRPESKTFLKHFAVELDSKKNLGLYLGEGFAHAVLTLEDNSEIEYLVSQFYTPEKESGVRWDDPSIDVNWPFKPVVISKKDLLWPNIVK